MSTAKNIVTYGLDVISRTKAPGNSQLLGMLEAYGLKWRVAIPGVIESFDPVTQTCVVKPALQDLLRVNNLLQWSDIYPCLDVPVVMPRAGGFAITLPVIKGDEVLLVFLDNCMDAWWQSGCTQDAAGNYVGQYLLDPYRRHDLSDAVAIIGMWSQPNVLPNYSPDTLQIRDKTGRTVIDIANGVITLTANTNVTVNSTGGTCAVNADNVQINATDTCSINAETIELNASDAVNISTNGGTYSTHQHSGVSSGGSTTGPIVPGT
jgi:hypothetical protein